MCALAFYIINELGADDGGLGAADVADVFGNPGDWFVAIDWNGDAQFMFGEPGWFPATGTFETP